MHRCTCVGACPTRHFSSLVKITLFFILSVYVWERGGGGGSPLLSGLMGGISGGGSPLLSGLMGDVDLYHHAAVHLCAYVGACPTRHFSLLVNLHLSLFCLWGRGGGGGGFFVVEWTNGRCGSVSPCCCAPLCLCRSLLHQTFLFIGKNHTFLFFVCVCVREGGGGGPHCWVD